MTAQIIDDTDKDVEEIIIFQDVYDVTLDLELPKGIL